MLFRSLKRSGKLSYSDTAVLYRTNAQSRLIEEQLVREGIPYDIVGGTNFYSRREIKDLLAYLKTIDNGRDDIAVKRIINVPKRAIGETTLKHLQEYADENGNFIEKYIKNPLIKKEIYGLKDYGALFTNNILNEEQEKQIKDNENSNKADINIGKIINTNYINNNTLFNFKFPSFFDFNKENNFFEPLNFKNILNNINLDNNKEQNLSEANNKNINAGSNIFEKENESKEQKEETKQKDNILNLPDIPSFLNDKTEETNIKNIKNMNISNNIFNNNMINFTNDSNPLFNNFFNNDLNLNLFSEKYQQNINTFFQSKNQIPINHLLFAKKNI